MKEPTVEEIVALALKNKYASPQRDVIPFRNTSILQATIRLLPLLAPVDLQVRLLLRLTNSQVYLFAEQAYDALVKDRVETPELSDEVVTTDMTLAPPLERLVTHYIAKEIAQQFSNPSPHPTPKKIIVSLGLVECKSLSSHEEQTVLRSTLDQLIPQQYHVEKVEWKEYYVPKEEQQFGFGKAGEVRVEFGVREE